MIPKCTSPSHRHSPTGPTCSSPLDPTMENINFIKEDSIYKRIKDNKNQVAKHEPKNLNNRRRNLSARESDRPTSKEKPVLQKPTAKTIIKRSPPEKSSDQDSSDGKDPKSSLTKNATCTSASEVPNDIPKDACVFLITDKESSSCPKSSEIEIMKNKLNVSVKEANNRIISEKRGNPANSKKIDTKLPNSTSEKVRPRSSNTIRPAYSTVSRTRHSTGSNVPETPKMIRSKTTLGVRETTSITKTRPGTCVIVRRRLQASINDKQSSAINQNEDISNSVEVLTKRSSTRTKEDVDGWQTVRSRCRRGSTHNLNMSTRFHKPSTATSLPALSIDSPCEKSKNNCFTPDSYKRASEQCIGQKAGKNRNNEVEKVQGESPTSRSPSNDGKRRGRSSVPNSLNDTNSTSMIAAVFKSEAELLEKRIQQFMAAQAERERIILEEERKTEEADSQRSQQLSDEEAFLQRQIMELEFTDIDVDTETDETDGETVLEIDDRESVEPLADNDDISLEDR